MQLLTVTSSALWQISSCLWQILIIVNFATETKSLHTANGRLQCKSFPGDQVWPRVEDWNAFNKTLGGALIKTVPIAARCHDGPLYDATQCAVIRANFRNSSLHMSDPASIMGFWTEGATCVPTNDASSPCTLGGYPVYVVNATTVRHVQLAVNFARNNNIRLVIKNTGHDFLGKSVGAGALSLWTHHLKGIEFLPSLTIGNYSGRAARFGAGVQSFEVYDFAASVNATFVAPGGTTVGVFGGYMQGGGHSVVSSRYGLAADQVLSMEVVTADAQLVIVSARSHPDLFWAIRGGGGSSFGIVTSVTMKAHPVTSVTFTSLAFDTTPGTGVSLETFWEGVQKIFAFHPQLCDDKGFSLIFVQSRAVRGSGSRQGVRIRTASGQPTYSINFNLGYTGTDIPEAETAAASLLAELHDIGINLTARFEHFPTFTDYFRLRAFGDSVSNSRYITRLFPRENFEEQLLANTVGVVKDTVSAGYTVIAGGMSPTLKAAGNPDNAINPVWRRTIMHVEAVDPLPDTWSAEELKSRHERMDRWVQPWRDVTPGGGSYLNEADVQEPNWQESFYGVNYPRLLAIKKNYDPLDIFYATTAVGSEEWQVKTEDGTPTQNGRLCRL